MLLATSNKSRRLLFLTYVGHVRPDEIKVQREEIKTLAADLSPEYQVLVDFCRLESMDPASAPELGLAMELIDQTGGTLVVRVIPDPSKDIGMTILSLFHYRRHVRVVTCATMDEAIKALSF